jgi:hypothetical protein
MYLKDSFFENGYQIFENYLEAGMAGQLAKEIIGHMSVAGTSVDDDGIKMLTANGEKLINSVPSVNQFHRRILTMLQTRIPSLHALKDSAVGVSANAMLAQCDHRFRYHFDRHEITAIIYLESGSGMPLLMYPRIRKDPRAPGSSSPEPERFCLDTKSPVVVEPHSGRMVVFEGRRTFHGVQAHVLQKDLSALTPRVSLQFGFDSQFLTFEGEKYYGRTPQ